MATLNSDDKDRPGLWFVDDKAKPELLERILDKATSPSLLIKLSDSTSEQLLNSMRAGGWNVIATVSEPAYRMLAYEGGLDFVIHDELKEGELKIEPGTVKIDFDEISAANVHESISNFDRKFLQTVQPEIVFIGNDKLYNKLQGVSLDISKEIHEKLRKGLPTDTTGMVICDARKLSKPDIAKELKRSDLPLVVLDEYGSEPHKIKYEDLDNISSVQSAMRSALAAYARQDINKPRRVVYVEGFEDELVKKHLKSLGHYMTILKRERLLKLVNTEASKKPDMGFLRRADAVVGPLSDDYLRFVEAAKIDGELPAKFCAMAPYEKNVERLRSLLFLLNGGFAFLPMHHRSLNMLDIILRKIHRRPRLPLRVLYEKLEGKKLAGVCRKAEDDLLSEEVSGIQKGISALFEASNEARTGLPAATLAYGLYHLHRLSKTHPVITKNTLSWFSKAVSENYRHLRKRISPYYVQKSAVESFRQTPSKEVVQNLRQQVFRIPYAPDYDFFHKVRPAAEAERYLKVFDYFSRLNRLQKGIRQQWHRLDIDWSVLEKPYDVGLAELFVFHKLQDDKYLLTEVEDFNNYKDLLEYLRENRTNTESVMETFENSVRQAARMAALGPLLATEQVGDLASFWASRFESRLYAPISEGLSRLFERKMPDEEFSKLEQSLNVGYRHLSSLKLIPGFYSDRWPGNMGNRKNKKQYNFGYRLCYTLPAVIEAATVFQHTDYLPGNTLDEKISVEQKFIRLFFEEFNSAAWTFNKRIQPKCGEGLKYFILKEIEKDVKSWKELKLQARAADKPIKDPIHMSIPQRESLTRVLLYPDVRTLSQMHAAVELLPDNSTIDDICGALQQYAVDIKEILPNKVRKTQHLYNNIKRHFKADKKILSRIDKVAKNLPQDADITTAREALYDELYEKPKQYVGLLKSFAQNMQAKQTLWEFEGKNRGLYEKALSEKYIPAYYVTMMERGLIAAAALIKKVTDLKTYTRCSPGHPFDSRHMNECMAKLDLAKMAVANSMRAAHYCQNYFAGKNEELVHAAGEIARFDKLLHDELLTGIGKAQGIYETRKAVP